MKSHILLDEDAGVFDLTVLGLGVGEVEGYMEFSPKEECVVCGVEQVGGILGELGLKYATYKRCGERAKKGELILSCAGRAKELHKAWKISQNILEYLSGIATYTDALIKSAREVNPKLKIATTRKNFPGAKEMMLKGVICGGGVPHRLGLYDSILVFKEHLEFFENDASLESGFKRLKEEFFEKKITVEVDSFEEAKRFAVLGADILQCEKMDLEELKKCALLKKEFPYLLLSATGGINLQNIQEFAKSGVDFVVTSSPYHAKPIDIKVEIKRG